MNYDIGIARAAGRLLADHGPTRRLRNADILDAVIGGQPLRVYWPDVADDIYDTRITYQVLTGRAAAQVLRDASRWWRRWG
jgi:hypothetical protein